MSKIIEFVKKYANVFKAIDGALHWVFNKIVNPVLNASIASTAEAATGHVCNLWCKLTGKHNKGKVEETK